MSNRRLGLSGLDRDEETRLRQLFEAVHEPGWSLAPEAEADVLLIDFDSMYGQMAWLRAQGGPRPIIALTAGGRADADYLLSRPASEKALRDVLRQVASGVPAPRAEPRTIAEPPAASDAPSAAAPQSEPIAAPAPQPEPEPPAPPRRVLLDYLQGGALPGPVRLRGAQPPLVLDLGAGVYLGGAALKPLLPLCGREIQPDEWEPLGGDTFARLRDELGGEQPISRLVWLAGLGGFGGSLCPALAGQARFKLGKWPQTEREFPRHLRIATALLKQFGSVEEMAAASGAAAGDVADYVNACHAAGVLEIEQSPGTTTGEQAKGGLLSRLRRG